MVQIEKVSLRLASLHDALGDLRRYRDSVTEERLRGDPDARNMVLHAMYVATQAAIDLALHALADADRPTPASYREAFPSLATAGLIDPGLAGRLAKWAGLRNVVAYHYPLLRYELVHAALAHDLGDLEAFAATVAGWIGAAGATPAAT